jgi:hypothetical protein
MNYEGDGWVAYTPANQRYAIRIHLSYKPTPDRWVVDRVEFAGPRITARDLRDLPLLKIEVWVNQLAQQGLVDLVEGKLTDTVQFSDPTKGRISWIPKPPPAPVTGPKPDKFYQRFAEIYRKAALASTRPAAALAEAWELPSTTVHRWIREARRRGHLPQAEQGRRG